MKRKFVSIMILTCLLINIFSVTAYANTETPQEKANRTGEMVYIGKIASTAKSKLSYNEKINILIKKGIAQEDAITLPMNIIDDLIISNNPIVSYSITPSNVEPNNNNIDSSNNMVTADSMPQTDIYIYNFTTRIYEKSGDNFQFDCYSNWIVDPVWKITDVIGSAWSGDFALYSDTCTYTATTGLSSQSWACPRNNVSVSAGVAHNVDLKTGYYIHKIKQTIKVYNSSNRTGTGNLVTNYAHKLVGVTGITASFAASGGNPEVGFSASLGVIYETGVPGYRAFDY